ESIVNTSREFLTLIASNYRYEAVNDAYCEAHVKRREDILGSTVKEIWGEATFTRIIKGHLDHCFKGEEVHYQSWFEMPRLNPRYSAGRWKRSWAIPSACWCRNVTGVLTMPA